MTDTLIFIPAWNEEENLPAVLDGLHAAIPDADILVVDDGSTDRTAEVAREHGAEVNSLGANRGLRVGIAAGYRWALDRDYAFCGRVDADGQHPPHELARLLALVRADECTKTGDCSTSSSCSVSVSSVNGVTTTTKSGDCADTTTTTSSSALDLDFLRALIGDLLVWFRFAAGM